MRNMDNYIFIYKVFRSGHKLDVGPYEPISTRGACKVQQKKFQQCANKMLEANIADPLQAVEVGETAVLLVYASHPACW